ncbi:RES family NAD+ phosphorylase [Paenibacillus agilis]|uniref:RES family NAD+ phosphorylase n=1 Tax=Paenibacillus agilis TaxID=3020863 RepID=UPI001649BF65|nr:RES family NAD+ phosphorylase [Paenibacillus agilis]
MTEPLQLACITETTMCTYCWEDLSKVFDKHGHNLSEDAGYEVLCAPLEEWPNCEVCRQKINSEDEYYIVSVDDAVLENVVDKISKEIGGCEYCEGQERGYLAYKFNQDLDSEETPIDASGESLSSYLGDRDVPDNFIALFAGFVNCPRCGNGRDADPYDNPGTWLNENSEIYTIRDVSFFWGDDFYDEDALLEYCNFTSKYGYNIDRNNLTEFGEFLIKHPTMGTKHRVGEMLFQSIQRHKQEGKGINLKPTVDTGILLFRGRSRKEDSEEQYTGSKMWSPPEGHASHGRYNPIGVPVLYLTSDLEAVAYEIHALDDEVIDIANFEIKKELLLFDIGVFNYGFEGFFEDSRADSRLLKHRYLLPNFIGACCSFLEYDGVSYTGVRNKDQYTNYALFTQENDQAVGITNEINTYKQEIIRKLSVIESQTEDKEESAGPGEDAELPF